MDAQQFEEWLVEQWVEAVRAEALRRQQQAEYKILYGDPTAAQPKGVIQ